MTLDIGIAGISGRMGAALRAALDGRADMACVIGLDAQPGDIEGVTVTSDLGEALGACDVMIDFSAPAVTTNVIRSGGGHRCRAIVSGTTGLSPEQQTAIDAVTDMAVMQAGNFSLGIALLEAMTRQAAKSLDWDIDILEMHHNQKVDAPSGTALMLGHAAASGRDIELDSVATYARQGQTGTRPAGEIGFATLRGGNVIGDHDVILAGPSEMLTLSHRALDRSVFANGALSAAKWLAGQPTGHYQLSDMLGLG